MHLIIIYIQHYFCFIILLGIVTTVSRQFPTILMCVKCENISVNTVKTRQ